MIYTILEIQDMLREKQTGSRFYFWGEAGFCPPRTKKNSVNSHYSGIEVLAYLKDRIGKLTPYKHTA